MKVGVLFVHGMGETQPEYSYELRGLLRSYTSKKVYDGLVFQEAYYQGILQDNEERYFNAVRKRVDWDQLRKFLLYGSCDGASLESQKVGKTSPYYLAQKELVLSLKALRRRIDATAPVIIVAQSLGGGRSFRTICGTRTKPIMQASPFQRGMGFGAIRQGYLRPMTCSAAANAWRD